MMMTMLIFATNADAREPFFAEEERVNLQMISSLEGKTPPAAKQSQHDTIEQAQPDTAWWHPRRLWNQVPEWHEIVASNKTDASRPTGDAQMEKKNGWFSQMSDYVDGLADLPEPPTETPLIARPETVKTDFNEEQRIRRFGYQHAPTRLQFNAPAGNDDQLGLVVNESGELTIIKPAAQ